MSDGTNYDYSLLRVISKQKVSDTLKFVMIVDPLLYYPESQENNFNKYTLQQINDSVYIYMDEVEIEIPNYLQVLFNQKIKDNLGFRGVFNFVHYFSSIQSRNRIRLIKII